jgi:hypothetical protein
VATLHIPRRHLRKRKSWTIIGLFYVPFRISTKDQELNLPSLYWIPKSHKCYFKKLYIAGSTKCSTKPLSKLLTCILSAVKTGFRATVTLATREVVWIRCGFWRTRKSTYNLGPSPPALPLKHLRYLPFTLLFLTLSWRTN